MKWAFRAVAAGLCITLAGTLLAAAANTGTLKITTPGMVLKLKIQGKDYPIPPNKAVSLPAGAYKTAGIELYAPEPRTRNLWRLNGGATGKLAQVEIKAGEETTVEGGQPITVRAPVSMSTKAGLTTVLIGLAYNGTSGEYYSSVVYKGRARVPNPKLLVVAENGQVIHKAQFEYG